MTIAPWFRCRVMTYEKEKEFGFTFQTTPFSVEFVHFSMSQTESGVWVKCSRKSEGLFSILDQMNWQEKSKILQKLDQIVPKISKEDPGESESSIEQANMQFGGFASKQDYINYAINMGMKGDMDYVNAIPEKTIRGMAKACFGHSSNSFFRYCVHIVHITFHSHIDCIVDIVLLGCKTAKLHICLLNGAFGLSRIFFADFWNNLV